MKILICAGHIYNPNNMRLRNCATGLGTFANRLIENLSDYDIDIIFYPTEMLMTSTSSLYCCEILNNVDLRGVYESSFLQKYLKYFCKCSSDKKIRNVFIISNFIRVLKKFRPDIVHLNSLNFFTYVAIKICDDMDIPYILTVHNFFHKDSLIKNYDEQLRFGNLILESYTQKIVTVSSGVKRRILEFHSNILAKQIKVILNGTKIVDTKIKTHTTYDKKILLCIGTICDRKNQIQLVRAFDLLPQDIQQKIQIHFYGKDAMKGSLFQIIEEAQLQECLIYKGCVPLYQMPDIYANADGVISVSKNESFGLVFIEGFAAGIPAIWFNDLDASEDLENSSANILIKERTDESVAKAINEWYLQQWDRDKILHFSNTFSAYNMAMNYYQEYKKIISRYNVGDRVNTMLSPKQ